MLNQERKRYQPIISMAGQTSRFLCNDENCVKVILSMDKNILAAACGLYCGACPVHVYRERNDYDALKVLAMRYSQLRRMELQPEDLVCNGCLSSQLAKTCRQCNIRDCAETKGLTHCSRCREFPCKTIINFNNDGRLHHAEVLFNIRRQKQIGIDSWLDEQDKRWRCVACKSRTEWYDNSLCPHCIAIFQNQFKSTGTKE
jgi:hypothetical protein